ncbi:hypothetical protein ILUMI_15994 [Ignelater luminosus]|uniref:Uncharacterized protein n=1 Tax=Ignelater luminosus TaxID=2038154 RepID=A0A8K0CPF0_IGNLU|nr:hypothetical protein ILUMI_15994 [Ignelater luminosus]
MYSALWTPNSYSDVDTLEEWKNKDGPYEYVHGPRKPPEIARAQVSPFMSLLDIAKDIIMNRDDQTARTLEVELRPALSSTTALKIR